ncbi:MAG TPA: trigger factor [Pseudomonadales bacterium]
MQVSIETTSGLERRLTIAIPAGKIQSEVDSRVQKVAPQVKLDGFRPGKVPVRVVRQRFGESIRQEVLGELMSESFQQAVIEEKLKPAGQPQVETKQNEAGKDFSFVATFEVYPDIAVKDLAGVEVIRPVTEITDADVDGMLETLRKQQASFVDSDKAAEDGDQVVIDFDGFKDGEPFDGGKGEDHTLVLGSNSMIPGFEAGLVGAKAGEERTLDLTFPEDYHAEHLKGAAVQFKVKVKAVKAQQLPEIDEEFMKKFGVSEGGIDALKAEVRKNMARELKQAVKNHVKKQVMDALLEKNSFDVPAALIEQEINAMRRQMVQQFGAGAENLDLASLLPAEMFSEQAGRRVKLGLLLAQLIEDRSIEATDDKVRAVVEEIASAYEAAEEVINYYYNNRQQLAQVQSLVIEDEAVDALLASADVNDQKMSYDELMKAVSAQ